jgi:hypothetical protein
MKRREKDCHELAPCTKFASEVLNMLIPRLLAERNEAARDWNPERLREESERYLVMLANVMWHPIGVRATHGDEFDL